MTKDFQLGLRADFLPHTWAQPSVKPEPVKTARPVHVVAFETGDHTPVEMRPCVCGEPWRKGTFHRGQGPCYSTDYAAPPPSPEAAPKFKAGDRVRVVRSGREIGAPAGASVEGEGEVITVQHNGNTHRMQYIVNLSGYWAPLCSDHLELVRPTEQPESTLAGAAP